MKKGIHPKYFKAKVVCACGAEYEVYSTKEKIEVETCKNCAPIFIGTEEKKAIVGQLEKFYKKYKKSAT
uniref:50S ribosomal protein L31 n=1 Tax=candidate division WOR-3 bacterium TaxID=2052148 RepID=A0A7V3ZSU7_UNCW3